MSNELATVPQYLMSLVKPNIDKSQFGQLESQDFGLSFVKMVYQNSKPAMQGWGPTGQEAAYPLGTMYLSRSFEKVEVGTSFIPLYRNVKYIHWDGKPGDGKLIFMTDNKNDERITKFAKDQKTGRWINGLAFTKDSNTGVSIPPPVTTCINFYVMMPGVELPVVLSFKRTSTNDGHKLTQDIMVACKASEGYLPMYALRYKFGPVQVVRDGSQMWYKFSWIPAGFTPSEVIPKAAQMAETARALSEMSSAAEFTGEIEAEETEPVAQQHQNPAAPATIDVQPTSVTTASAQVQLMASAVPAIQPAIAAPQQQAQPAPTGMTAIW